MTNSEIQVLLDQPQNGALILSCYADTTVTEGFEAHWRQHLKAEARQLRESLAGNLAARPDFDRGLEAIWKKLEDNRAKGMAVFFFAASGEAVALPADEPYANRLVVDEEPYLVPILLAASRRRTFLCVMTDTHRGRLYSASPGSLRLLAELDEAVPRKQRASGERWGKQQATIARHREDHILHYLKELARKMEELWTAQPKQAIVLLGQHELLAHLRDFLPKRIAEQVVHEAAVAWTDTAADILAEIQQAQRALAGEEEKRLLAEVDGRLKQGYAVTTGPQEVLDALKNGQAASVLIGPGLGEAGSHCQGCASVFNALRDVCPYCGSACKRVNLLQEIALLAYRHGVPIKVVDTAPARGVAGDVVALLGRDQPPWGQPPTWQPEPAGTAH